VHYFDGGHFVLDEFAEPIAEAIIETFSHERGSLNAEQVRPRMQTIS
jgi:surfactin synthase thioesterase subunit